eukprot:TRINITY_DN8567_c0_g1_i1.p1 TRINITY_DN8567_c0_g1~~TRINITY_DN8567_c0_g1_i1.p1  ORF type:complete len:327 (+),score=1.09 TRINITY_DN8567_c0_g1_i1:178-1158(+)
MQRYSFLIKVSNQYQRLRKFRFGCADRDNVIDTCTLQDSVSILNYFGYCLLSYSSRPDRVLQFIIKNFKSGENVRQKILENQRLLSCIAEISGVCDCLEYLERLRELSKASFELKVYFFQYELLEQLTKRLKLSKHQHVKNAILCLLAEYDEFVGSIATVGLMEILLKEVQKNEEQMRGYLLRIIQGILITRKDLMPKRQWVTYWKRAMSTLLLRLSDAIIECNHKHHRQCSNALAKELQLFVRVANVMFARSANGIFTCDFLNELGLERYHKMFLAIEYASNYKLDRAFTEFQNLTYITYAEDGRHAVHNQLKLSLGRTFGNINF